MKVKELIKELQKFDEELETCILQYDEDPTNSSNGIEIKHLFEIKGHPDNDINRVYIREE